MKKLLLLAAAATAMMGSTAAMARVNLDISIGVPGIIYSEPDYYYPPVRYVERPRVVVVPERVYTPVPVYRSRYYREEYRGPRYYKHSKHHHKHRRGHRGDWDD
ncbi:MAG: virulence factor [Burkholderiaceae bacterium]